MNSCIHVSVGIVKQLNVITYVILVLTAVVNCRILVHFDNIIC